MTNQISACRDSHEIPGLLNEIAAYRAPASVTTQVLHIGDGPENAPIQLETQIAAAAAIIGSTRRRPISWNEPKPTENAPAEAMTPIRKCPVSTPDSKSTVTAGMQMSAPRNDRREVSKAIRFAKRCFCGAIGAAVFR